PEPHRPHAGLHVERRGHLGTAPAPRFESRSRHSGICIDAELSLKKSISSSETRAGSSCCSQWVASAKVNSSALSQYSRLACAISARRKLSRSPQRIRVGTCTTRSATRVRCRNAARYQFIIAVSAPGCDQANRYCCKSSSEKVPGRLERSNADVPILK